MPSPVDHNGQLVLHFTDKVRNLARVAELTSAVTEIATSGAWRSYNTAAGTESWREAEFDYFLIASDMHYEDVSRILAWNKHAQQLAPMMDTNADPDRRRPIDQAASRWTSPTGETLLQRAQRLGWLHKNGRLRASPIPGRARAKARHGETLEQHASRVRTQLISGERRRELDLRASKLLNELLDDGERRYLVERLRLLLNNGSPAGARYRRG